MDAIHQSIPSDGIEITEEQYADLLNSQASGKQIVYKSRKVQAVDYEPDPLTWNMIRNRRDQYLADSDWTQIPDNGLTSANVLEWKSYRQALRDITEQFSAPDLVVWPDIPEEIKEG